MRTQRYAYIGCFDQKSWDSYGVSWIASYFEFTNTNNHDLIIVSKNLNLKTLKFLDKINAIVTKDLNQYILDNDGVYLYLSPEYFFTQEIPLTDSFTAIQTKLTIGFQEIIDFSDCFWVATSEWFRVYCTFQNYCKDFSLNRHFQHFCSNFNIQLLDYTLKPNLLFKDKHKNVYSKWMSIYNSNPRFIKKLI